MDLGIGGKRALVLASSPIRLLRLLRRNVKCELIFNVTFVMCFLKSFRIDQLWILE